MTFNLVHDPWIPVLGTGGVVEVGLHEAVTGSPRYLALAGESPLDRVATLRLLLAYLHRALRGPADEQEWLQWWQAGEFPADKLDAYADAWWHRFFLFGDAPFFQTPDLEGNVTANGEPQWKSWLDGSLIPGWRAPFTPRQGEAAEFMSEAQAARWVVTMQSFDGAGIKTFSAKDKTTGIKVLAGKAYGSPRGWADRLANLNAVGDTLFETLMANLVGYEFDEEDRPAWERPVTVSTRSRRPPDGRCDVYTWQADRILLHRDDAGRIAGAYRSPGDMSDPTDQTGLEPLTTWRLNQTQTKQNDGVPVYSPANFEAPAQMWRGISQVIRPDSRRAEPMVVSWVARLFGWHAPDRNVRWESTVVERDSNGTVIQNVKSDALDMPVSLLTDKALADALATTLAAVSSAAQEYGQFVMLAAMASRRLDERDDKARKARTAARKGGNEVAFSRLDPVVRAWLDRLDLDEIDAEIASLRTQARSVLLGLGQETLNTAPTTAWRSAERVTGKNKTAMSLAKAHSRFTYRVKRHLEGETNE